MDHMLPGMIIPPENGPALIEIGVYLPISNAQEILSVILNKSDHILRGISQQHADLMRKAASPFHMGFISPGHKPEYGNRILAAVSKPLHQLLDLRLVKIRLQLLFPVKEKCGLFPGFVQYIARDGRSSEGSQYFLLFPAADSEKIGYLHPGEKRGTLHGNLCFQIVMVHGHQQMQGFFAHIGHLLGQMIIRFRRYLTVI